MNKVVGFEPVDFLVCLEKYTKRYLEDVKYERKEIDIEMCHMRVRGAEYSEIGAKYGVSAQRALRRVKYCANKIKFYLRQDQSELFLGLQLGEIYLDAVGRVVQIVSVYPFPDYECEISACSKNKLKNHNYIFGGTAHRKRGLVYDFHGKPVGEKTKHPLIKLLTGKDGYHYG